MKFLEDGRIVLRFTFSFIIHQFLLLLFVAIPALIYFYHEHWDLTHPNVPNIHENALIVCTVIFYVIYCVFYGYYVAYPMIKIILGIRKLTSDEYDSFKQKYRVNFSAHLYKEVFANLDFLSSSLKEEERKRKEFEEQRRDWAAGITHDLKTPLSYIQGYSNMLLSEDYDWTKAEQKNFLQIIRDKSEYTKALIDDLGLAFQVEDEDSIRLQKEKLELVESLRQVLAEIANYPNHHSNFELATDVNELYVLGDNKLLHRAFSNLLINSLTHNPDDVTIKVTIQGNQADNVIRISDNGKGMNEDEVAHLFDRYYRGTASDTHIAGTGLGMAIVKQIIDLHGGSIQVESKPGTGTSFIIKLPTT